MVVNLTEGNVGKLLLTFSLPLFASNALQALYNIVDMVVVGQVLGGSGMSAVSIGGDILHLITFIAIGFSSAGQVIIARNVGSGELDKVKKQIGTMFTFLLGISLIMAIVCYILRDQILLLLNTPAEAYKYTMDYTVTCIFGLFFIYGYNIVSAILRGMGDSKRPFFFVGIAAVLNTILDIVFVAYCGMEVYGAALATVIGQGVSFIISIIYLYRHREAFCFDFKLKSFDIDKEAFSSLMALGVPMAIQSASISFSKIVLTAWINIFGVVASAVSGIYNKINMMAGVISQAYMASGSSMVGQNLGARKYKRVSETLLYVALYVFVIYGILSVVVMIWPEAVYSIFTTDAQVLAFASVITIPTIINFIGSGARSVAFSLINGSGNTKLNLLVAILDGIVFRIGLSYLLGFTFGMGCSGFWYGDALAGFIPLVIAIVFYISGKWKK